MTGGLPAAGTVLFVSTVNVTTADLERCAELTQETSPPFGIGCVIALWGLCDWGGLPNAAIMRGYRARWGATPTPGSYVTEGRVLAVGERRRRYAAVDLGYQTVRDETLILTQVQEVLWPIS